jgi:putative addiction module component (TIGR02574 family)
MSPATEHVLQAALALPEEERLDLVDAILASLGHESELPFDPSVLIEIDRRSAEIETGSVQTTPWTTVRERVRRALEQRANHRGPS